MADEWDFVIDQGDYGRTIRKQLVDAKNNPLNLLLPNVSCVFKMWLPPRRVLINAAATIDPDQVNYPGWVQYTFQQGDSNIATPSNMDEGFPAVWIVTATGIAQITVPNEPNRMRILVRPTFSV